MKLLLIGAASAAALAIAAPAAAQYPPPPPPPPDADQYGPQGQNQSQYQDQGQDQDQGVYDDQDAGPPQDMGPGDEQGPPDDQDQGYDQGQDQQQGYAPPPAYQPPQSGQGYVPPGQDHYGPAEGGYAGPPPPPPYPYENDRQAPPPSYGPPPGAPQQGFDGGPAYATGQDLSDREDRLEQRIRRMADRGAMDPRSANAALAELHSIQAEQDRMEQAGQGLDPVDAQRLNQRLDALQQRLRGMRGGG